MVENPFGLLFMTLGASTILLVGCIGVLLVLQSVIGA